MTVTPLEKVSVLEVLVSPGIISDPNRLFGALRIAGQGKEKILEIIDAIEYDLEQNLRNNIPLEPMYENLNVSYTNTIAVIQSVRQRSDLLGR
ncbi:MAG: hypothetical protein WBC05_15945 [Sedimentisphaerales bacterium]